MYKHIIKPFLFLFSPDTVHRAIIVGGSAIQAIPGVRWLLGRCWGYQDQALEQHILGLDFANPVGLSAGFDKNVQLSPLLESVGFGFETGGSVTMESRPGNPRPWFHRLPHSGSIVVHAGLANKGIATIRPFIERNQPRIEHMQLITSVAVVAKAQDKTHDGAIDHAYETSLYIIQHRLAQAIEINISCPNAGDAQPFTRPELLRTLLGRLDTIDRSVPFFIKMPNMSDGTRFDELLDIIVEHNIQGVTIANLVKEREGVALNDPLSDEIKGGLSGVPTRDRSTALIRQAYQRHGDKLVIIGVGGVFSAEHAYEKIRAGASLVALITGLIFEGPGVVKSINRGLVELLRRDGFHSIAEAVGADNRK